jgi:Domain of unknown function (DUF4349)
MRLRDHDMPLDPDVERELEAIDHALRGLRVATDLEDLRDLAVDARADRPAVEPDFGIKLDQWAAAGFPREGRLGARNEEAADSALSGLLDRVRSVPPRRLLLSTGAAATLVVAVAVGIGVSGQLGGSDRGAGTVVAPSSTGGPAVDKVPAPIGAPPSEAQRSAAEPSIQSFGAPHGVPLGDLKPSFRANAQAGFASGGRAAHRKVAQNVNLVLATEPQKVRNVADGVVAVVDKYNGYIVSSNVTSGRGPTPVPLERGDTGQRVEGTGTFRLRIPASNLKKAVDEMSDLGHVASRSDGTIDITNRFDAAQTRVDDLETQRQHLLRQLAHAVTITEQESLKQRLRIVENQLADAQDHLGHLQTRIRLVPVTVEIRGQEGVDSGGAWSIGDAFHDAGQVLTVIVGILLISLAVLAPLGLIGAVAWITARAVIRRRREDALE